jgi:hypothetical protein
MMTRHSLPLLLAFTVTLALTASACDSPHTLESEAGPTVSQDGSPPALHLSGVTAATSDVYRFADMEGVAGARAELLRTPDALRTRTHTAELDHGHVITLWWVIFNHPEHCEHGAAGMSCGEGDLFDGPTGPTGVEPSCVYADGSVVGGNGRARFQDRITVGDSPRDSCIDFFVEQVPELQGTDHGLTNPRGAEVHLVLRSHGPRIPGLVFEQRRTFAGGCLEFLEPGATHELEPGQCSDLQFALFAGEG